MTTILFRYFFVHLFKVVVSVLLAITVLFFVLDLLNNLGRPAIGLLANIRDAVLEIPKVIYLALPASCAIGAAIGLAVLDGKGEIALLRTMGASASRLGGWMVVTSLIWVLTYLAVSEFVLPKSAALNRAVEIQRSGSLLTSSDTIWLKTSDGFARLNPIGPAGDQALDVWTFTGPEHTVTEVRRANHALFTAGSWRLVAVEQATFADGTWQFNTYDELPWAAGPDPELLISFSIAPTALPITRLLAVSAALRKLRQNTVAIDLIVWSRLCDALSIIVLMLASFVLVRNRIRPSTAAARNTGIISLLVMLAYYYFQVIVRQHTIDQDWPAYVGAALPPVLLASTLALARWAHVKST